jgi:biopolymer transport protein TolR
MAMDVGGAKGGLKADINVTPLVDVMLVLLIIMMLVAPMLQKGVDVKLPQAANTSDKPDTQEQTVLHVTADSRYFVNGVPIDKRDAADRIANVLEDKKEKVVLIKGDTDAPYSAIMEMMDDLRKANIENVGLITERKLRPGETGGK